jgi:hypothetical protein
MHLHATWTPDGSLFFWSTGEQLDRAVAQELPAVASLPGTMTRRVVAVAEEAGVVRRKVAGWEVPVGDTLGVLSSVDGQSDLSDSVRVWSFGAKLALELAAAQRVVPTVKGGQAYWMVLLTRGADRDRFEAFVEALPPVARAVPTQSRGAIRLSTAPRVARAFLDQAVDSLFRQEAHPGSARGWALELATALKGGETREFQPREARYQGVPEMLSGWASDAETFGLRLGIGLDLPAPDGTMAFRLRYWLHPSNDPSQRIPLEAAWQAGKAVEIGGITYPHPATAALTGLARMSRIYEPLAGSLQGNSPRALKVKANQAWDFIANGASMLREAGFEVELPEAFAAAGSRRIRARMRVEPPPMDGGTYELEDVLRFRWEIVLGDRVLTGEQFAELTATGSPIVEFDGDWVLLDPAEVARLPTDVPREGELSAPVALRAVLTGHHEGAEVVADDRLELVLDALRSPPPVPAPEGLAGTLRPYQEAGLAWLSTLGQLGLGSCLADDMGLGKTLQLIAHILRRRETRPGRGPCLVVCPTSVLGNWKREIARFAPGLRVERHHGSSRSIDRVQDADVVLTTYGLLVRDLELLQQVDWDVLALDEAQAIKNPDSRRARAACELRARHRVAMTGTPVENRLDELWSLFHFLVPGLLEPRATFRRKVAVPVERFGDQDIAHRLKLGISPFLLRRLKSDPAIQLDLPEKLETVDYCALKGEQATLYRQIVDDTMGGLAGAEPMARRGRVLAMLTRLKQVCNHPVQVLDEADGELTGRSGKLERCTELLDTILEMREKALIFTQYRVMGDLLQRHLLETWELEVPFLHGGVPAEGRDDMVARFQAAGPLEAPFLIISLKAGGTGLNLTAATHVIHYDRWWNPAVEDQATDRAYRIGQTRNVQVHKMVSQGTLEERIHEMLEDKRRLADSVVGAGEAWITELDDDALRALVMLGDDAVEDA